jgi:outer membrane beta-barrel protein
VKRILATLVASVIGATTPALAQTAPAATTAPVLSQDAGGDDDLDDILGEGEGDGDGERTVGEEQRDIERDEDPADKETVTLPPAKKKVIKTLQKKTFLKLGRGEFMPYVGIITNDPFIRRILFGGNLGYHVTEIFEIELQGSFAPNFGEGDWKAITQQIIDANQVSPEISRMMWHLTANLNFSPFYGKVATLGRNSIIFDIYGTLGAGVVGTEDDIELIQKEDDERALATAVQIHPGITFGGGLRIAFNKTFALRFEVRSISYINALESTQLELKNNLTLMLGASIFFGRRME